MKRLRLPTLHEDARHFLNTFWMTLLFGIVLYYAIMAESPLMQIFGIIVAAVYWGLVFHMARYPNNPISYKSIDLLWQGIDMVDQRARRAEQKARQLSSDRLRYIHDSEFWAKYLLKYAQDNATNWPEDWETITLLEKHLKSIQRDLQHAQRDHSTFLDLYR